MSRTALPGRRRLGLVLCLGVALAPMRLSAQSKWGRPSSLPKSRPARWPASAPPTSRTHQETHAGMHEYEFAGQLGAWTQTWLRADAGRHDRLRRRRSAPACRLSFEPFHALIRQRGADATMVGSLRRLTCRHEQAPAGRCPVERRGGSRGRTAWPRPREPGTAGCSCPARALGCGTDEKGCARRTALRGAGARFGPCAKPDFGPSSPTSTPA